MPYSFFILNSNIITIMANNVNVKYKVTVWGVTYYPWDQKVGKKELTELLKAPFVKKLTGKDTEDSKTEAKGTETWADNVDTAWADKIQAGDETNSDNADTAELEQVEFTEEELRALPEEDLRKIYSEVQAAAGKTVPTNIKVDTIIANLLK